MKEPQVYNCILESYIKVWLEDVAPCHMILEGSSQKQNICPLFQLCKCTAQVTVEQMQAAPFLPKHVLWRAHPPAVKVDPPGKVGDLAITLH